MKAISRRALRTAPLLTLLLLLAHPTLGDTPDRAAVDPDLTLTKTVDNPSPFVGDEVTYTLTVTNNGVGDAAAVTIEDVLPPGAVFVSSTDGTYDPSTSDNVWDLPLLTDGSSITLDIVVEIITSFPVTNTATITSHPDDPVLEDNTASVTIVPLDQGSSSFWKNMNGENGTVTAFASTTAVPAGSGVVDGTLFAATDGGGLYRSIDMGDNWFPAGLSGFNARGLHYDDGCADYGDTDGLIGAVYDTGGATSIYADEAFGDSFTATSSQPGNNLVLALLGNADGTSINATPGCDDLFVATDGSGVYWSFDEGTSWIDLSAGSLAGTETATGLALEVDGGGAGDDRLYVSTFGDGVHMTDYTDFTVDFTDVTGDLPTAFVYDVFVDATGRVYAATSEGLYRAPTGGLVWTELLPDVTARVVAEADFGGGSVLFLGTDGNSAYKSEDDGATWASISGIDPTVLALHLATDGKLYAGTEDAGAWLYDDATMTFAQISRPNFTTVIQALTFSPAGDLLLAGTQGYGILVTDDMVPGDGLVWTTANNGLDNQFIYALESYAFSGTDYFFAGTWQDGVYRSTNGGQSWVEMGLPDRIIYDFGYCPADNILFAATDRGEVSRSVDNGFFWEEVGIANTAIWAIAVDPASCDILYAGTFGAGTFKSEDGGTTWVKTGMESGYAFDFAFDGAGDLYAATATGVEFSADGGDTWTDMSEGLGGYEVRTIAIDAGGTLLAGTWGGGIFVYDAVNGVWIRDGLENHFMNVFLVHPISGEVFAAAEGGSLHRKLFPPSANPVATDPQADVPTGFVLHKNYPNPFNPVTMLTYDVAAAGTVRLAVYDVIGREVARLVDGPVKAGQHQVAFDAADLPSGVYLYRLHAGGQVFTRAMILMK